MLYSYFSNKIGVKKEALWSMNNYSLLGWVETKQNHSEGLEKMKSELSPSPFICKAAAGQRRCPILLGYAIIAWEIVWGQKV